MNCIPWNSVSLRCTLCQMAKLRAIAISHFLQGSKWLYWEWPTKKAAGSWTKLSIARNTWPDIWNDHYILRTSYLSTTSCSFTQYEMAAESNELQTGWRGLPEGEKSIKIEAPTSREGKQWRLPPSSLFMVIAKKKANHLMRGIYRVSTVSGVSIPLWGIENTMGSLLSSY